MYLTRICTSQAVMQNVILLYLRDSRKVNRMSVQRQLFIVVEQNAAWSQDFVQVLQCVFTVGGDSRCTVGSQAL